ncbi:D-alanyl-D-alanine carboxypeptidase/D-alanyl-D-alanine-endopeptidase [Shewanella maritima]|uniref:D-alanyl-D-alanine carboxypeptidase/D-alanyl-D-alanine endopeptidase n=1 Tax=Shewanella maritima TaxID=2520507 RepID=UPI003734E19D
MFCSHYAGASLYRGIMKNTLLLLNRDYVYAIIFQTLGLFSLFSIGINQTYAATKAIVLQAGVKQAHQHTDKQTLPPKFSQNELTSKLEHIVSRVKQHNRSNVGVAIWSLDLQTIIYQHQSHQFFQPASVQKILTALVTQETLGKDFRYTTSLLGSKPLVDDNHLTVKNGIYDGDLLVQFSGDPSLTSKDLYQLLLPIQQAGIQKILGNIYVETTIPSDAYPPGWVWDDLGICYGAPSTGFAIDKNCIKGRVSAKQYGQPAIYNQSSGPLESWLKQTSQYNEEQLSQSFSNLLKLDTDVHFEKSSKRHAKHCRLSLHTNDNNHYKLSGCYPNRLSLPLSFAIQQPDKLALNYIDSILSLMGVSYQNITIPHTSMRNSKSLIHTLHRHDSVEIKKLLDELLLDSDNLIADSLLKTATNTSMVSSDSESRFNHASDFLKTSLSQLDLQDELMHVEDGSGLSRYNLLSPNYVLAVLKYIQQQTDLSNIISQMPVSGVSGTLRYKATMQRPPLKGMVQAKTGSMLGVSNLAGKVTTQHNGELLFVIFENGLSPHFQNNTTEAMDLPTIMLELLVTSPKLTD